MLAWLGRNPFLLVALSGALLLSGLAAGDLLDVRDDTPIFIAQNVDAGEQETIRVHVAGAVVRPGVYALRTGDRVEDAVAAAGGALEAANLDSVNLARHLRDGEQILVEAADTKTSVVLTPGEPLDLNVATLEELDALPGIGEAYSRRIVDSRVVDGPFRSVDEVLERGLIPSRTLEGIRSLVTVSLP